MHKTAFTHPTEPALPGERRRYPAPKDLPGLLASSIAGVLLGVISLSLLFGLLVLVSSR